MRRKDSTRWRPEPDSPSRTLARHPANLTRGLRTSTSSDPCKFGNAKNTKNKKDTKYQTLELLVLLLPFFQVVRDVQILKSNN